MRHPNRRYSKAELLAHVRSTELFGDVDEAVLQVLSNDLERVTLRDGEILFRQGDPGEALYIVMTGLLKVTISQRDGSEKVLAEIGPGKTVGEVQILAGGECTESAYAIGKTELVKLPKASFRRLAEKSPEVVQQMSMAIRRRLRRDQLVAILPSLFGPLDESMIQDIEAQFEWVHLRGDEVLFRLGDPGDSLYIVVSGRLRVLVEDEEGHEQVVGEMGRGEIFGEIALFAGESRTASIYAIRDSELVKCSKPAFERIIKQHPQVMITVIQTLINRLRKKERSSAAVRTLMNVAVVPASPDVPLSNFVNRLVHALCAFGSTLHLSSERLDRLLDMPGIAETSEDGPRNVRLLGWLDEQETKHRFIIYEADMSASPWTRRCIRQADQILLVAMEAANPKPGKIEAALLAEDSKITTARRALVLLHPDGSKLPSWTNQWLSPRQAERHHHLRLDTDADFGRLARFISGNATGLALGGGGARGFAHIGVIRALKEAGMPIDIIGGTSMGAYIAAQHAMGLDYEDMLRVNRILWIDSKPLKDYTLPIISLVDSRKFDRATKRTYGDTLIEDLWVNYFCLSTNLTTAQMVIHQKGLLSKALRASVSLPGIAVPVIDGNNLLVDGGVLNNLPGDIMRELCSGSMIAVDVTPDKDLEIDYEKFPSAWKILWGRLFPFQKSVNVPNILDVLMRAAMVSSVHRGNVVKMDADVYLRPPVDRFRFFEFKALNEIADIGYRYANEKIKGLKEKELFGENVET